MPIEILRKTDFTGLKNREVVTINGKTAVYLGQQYVKTCGCLSAVNCVQIPHVAYFDEQSGHIEVMEIRALNLPQPRKITGMSIIHVITKEDDTYRELETTLKEAELMT